MAILACFGQLTARGPEWLMTLAYWRAEIPGKVMAAAEAFTGPMRLHRRGSSFSTPQL